MCMSLVLVSALGSWSVIEYIFNRTLFELLSWYTTAVEIRLIQYWYTYDQVMHSFLSVPREDQDNR